MVCLGGEGVQMISYVGVGDCGEEEGGGGG